MNIIGRRMLLYVLVLLASMMFSSEEIHASAGTVARPDIKSLSFLHSNYCKMPVLSSIKSIKHMLKTKAHGMSEALRHKVISTLRCARNYHTRHSHILTVIDYSLPSNQKRLWVFDLQDNKVLYHTYVSHGLTSGALLSNQFSNRNNSKASSIGVYRTQQAYHGRHGLAVRLQGLEEGFNDNATRRAIVMHSAWYVNEDFIEKYGRPGRSWGCPAIDKALKEPIISTIKNNGLFIVYYPGERWILNSKFLNCQHRSNMPYTAMTQTQLKEPDKPRDSVLFIDNHKDKKRAYNQGVLALSADDYLKLFNNPAPLNRMLRQQIDKHEYIALSDKEFEALSKRDDVDEAMKHMVFVVPDVIIYNGRYLRTEMRILTLGEVKAIKADAEQQSFQVSFDKNNTPTKLKSTNEFIRWVGL